MDEFLLLVPEYDPSDPEPYPGGISPGSYTRNQVVELVRQHARTRKR